MCRSKKAESVCHLKSTAETAVRSMDGDRERPWLSRPILWCVRDLDHVSCGGRVFISPSAAIASISIRSGLRRASTCGRENLQNFQLSVLISVAASSAQSRKLGIGRIRFVCI